MLSDACPARDVPPAPPGPPALVPAVAGAEADWPWMVGPDGLDPPSWSLTLMPTTTATSTVAAAPAGSRRRRGGGVLNRSRRPPSAGLRSPSPPSLIRPSRGKPPAAHSSSFAAKSDSGAGASARMFPARSARSSRSGATSRPTSPASTAASSRSTSGSSGMSWSRLIAGPPQLLDDAVQPRARVGLRDADDTGDLGVGEPGKELERDQLPLARCELGDGGAQRRAPDCHFGAVVGGDEALVLRLGDERSAPPPPAKLVECRVASDPEQPRPPASAPRLEGPPSPVGALEGLGGHVLGSGTVAKKPGDIGID